MTTHQNSDRAVVDFEQVQAEVLEWNEKNFESAELWEAFVGAVEELGELGHHLLKRHQKIRPSEDHDAGIRDAVGDIVIFLMQFCSREGVYLADCVEAVWKEVRRRDWTENREDGGRERAGEVRAWAIHNPKGFPIVASVRETYGEAVESFIEWRLSKAADFIVEQPSGATKRQAWSDYVQQGYHGQMVTIRERGRA